MTQFEILLPTATPPRCGAKFPGSSVLSLEPQEPRWGEKVLIRSPLLPAGSHDMDFAAHGSDLLGTLAVCLYVALVITNFVWLFPVLTGMPISQQTWNMEIWLPSWR